MPNIAFLCDNFGPIHIDQCDALANALGDRGKVLGIELFSKSNVYAWGDWGATNFTKITMADGAKRENLGTLRMVKLIVGACLRYRVNTVLFAHYERPYIFLSAIIIRLLGRRALIMSDSKFDDYTRYIWREVGKLIMMSPYMGGIAASARCADYLRFLGVHPRHIRQRAYAIYPDRLRKGAGSDPAPEGVPFAEREFVCVARLVTKKNHLMLLDAYATYRDMVARPRKLILCGSGPMEPLIRKRISELGLDSLVDVRGNLMADEISRVLGCGLCLLLPSIEEQFGIVVLEAQVMGLPVILSINCGARDTQVQSGVHGFVVESDNPDGMAWFMARISEEEQLWRRMSAQALRKGNESHSYHFAQAVVELSVA